MMNLQVHTWTSVRTDCKCSASRRSCSLSLGRFEVRAADDGIFRGAEFLGLAELSDCLIYACGWRTMYVITIFVKNFGIIQ